MFIFRHCCYWMSKNLLPPPQLILVLIVDWYQAKFPHTRRELYVTVSGFVHGGVQHLRNVWKLRHSIFLLNHLPASLPFAHHSSEHGVSAVSPYCAFGTLLFFGGVTLSGSKRPMIQCSFAAIEPFGCFCHVYSVGGCLYHYYYYLEVCVALLDMTVPATVVSVVAGWWCFGT